MRAVKPKRKEHAFRGVEGEHEILFVRGGRNAYLWTGLADDGVGSIYTFSGQQALRALARAILKEIPARKPSRHPKDR